MGLRKFCEKFLDALFVTARWLERIIVISYAFGAAHDRSARHSWEETMDTKLYLTIAAVVAILYALGFLLIPVQTSLLFSGFAEPRAVLNLRFCGAAVLAWGLVYGLRGIFGIGTRCAAF